MTSVPNESTRSVAPGGTTVVAVVLLGAALSYPREEWFRRFLVHRPI